MFLFIRSIYLNDFRWITKDLTECDQIVKKHNCEPKLVQIKSYNLEILCLVVNHKNWTILFIIAG